MTITYRHPAAAVFALLPLALATPAHAQTTATLEEVVVSATLTPDDVNYTSHAVLDASLSTARNAQHLEDLLSAAPNVTTASGASRGRFFQIRGIGERSQFVEPINASVAMLLDGIDLTGIGAAGLLFDLDQVEVLRGPQGTLFGANALAGLINLKPAAADSGAISEVSTGIEQYGGWQAGLRVGGELSDTLHGRLAAQRYRSDGFTDNTFLGRDDTGHRDETQLRGQLASRWGQNALTLMWQHLDINNGYDAFSLDNTRETLSDEPGSDELDMNAVMARWQRTGDRLLSTLQLSATDADSEYSYDEDWAFVGIAPDLEYSSFDSYARDREMQSLEWRLQPADAADTFHWTVGTYLRREDESLQREYTFLPAPFSSDLEIQTAALFGQVDTAFSDKLDGFVGLRVEQRDSDYRDSAAVGESFREDYWSGRLGLGWMASEQHRLYTTVSRGVRAGGFNASLLASLEALPGSLGGDLAPLRFFDGESLISIEAGWQFNSRDGAISSRLALFNMRRSDQQVRGSLVIPREDGSTSFIDYTDNAARGNNRGIEWQGQWAVSERLMLSGAAGFLEADFDEYVAATGDDLSGRDQPQAPNWQYALRGSFQLTSTLDLSVEFTGMDSYFFSDRHDTRSPERNLINASANWRQGPWRATLWARNLADEDTFVRGFGSFGNDPRKGYVTEPYFQFGEPRVVGLSLAYNFSKGR